MSLREVARSKERRMTKRILSPKEVKRIKRRGYDAERELVQKLRMSGLSAMRVPVSAPSSEPFPDVFAVKDEVIMAFEVKARHKRYNYFKRKQVKKLFGYLDFHKIYPRRFAVLAAKFPRRGWTFKIIDKPGDYVIKPGEGNTLQELLNQVAR